MAKNYAFRPLPQANNGDTFDGYVFTRKTPHTAIFSGVTGLTFRKCVLLNCDLPADAIVEECKHGHVQFCGNVHPKLVEIGLLDACAANCLHVTSSDTIQVAGVTVDTVYYYSDKKVT